MRLEPVANPGLLRRLGLPAAALVATVVTGSLLQARDETPTSGTSGESGQRHRPPQPALGYMVVMFCHRTAPTGLVS